MQTPPPGASLSGTARWHSELQPAGGVKITGPGPLGTRMNPGVAPGAQMGSPPGERRFRPGAGLFPWASPHRTSDTRGLQGFPDRFTFHEGGGIFPPVRQMWKQRQNYYMLFMRNSQLKPGLRGPSS